MDLDCHPQEIIAEIIRSHLWCLSCVLVCKICSYTIRITIWFQTIIFLNFKLQLIFYVACGIDTGLYNTKICHV